MRNKPHVMILGAGPAGLGAAYQLVQKKLANVSVIEESETVGGIAASLEISGLRVDYGSHRLHRACHHEILKDIRSLLHDDLLDRPRHGRIRLRDRWIHFPLKPIDLFFRLPAGFTMEVAIDLTGKLMRRNHMTSGEETFASFLEAGLGRTICNEFYFPYTQKIWGLPPEELSVTQAYRRVSAHSIRKIFQKIFSAIPGIRTNSGGRFFYPRGGFGQISECLYKTTRDAGANFFLGTRIKSIQMAGQIIDTVCCEQNGKVFTHRADYCWSTIPVSDLLQYIQPSPPPLTIQASKNIKHRAMILVYLVLEQDHFSEYDAHYFPEIDIPITRLSEPKNYSNVKEPQDRTVLCAELPCSTSDPEWHMTDEKLGTLVCNCLESAAIPVKAPIRDVITRRLSKAYPIYRKGYEAYIDYIDQWLSQIDNLLTFGRQGLFVHDNTHHALYMGYAAAKCLDGHGNFNRSQWEEYRRIFDTHVVED